MWWISVFNVNFNKKKAKNRFSVLIMWVKLNRIDLIVSSVGAHIRYDQINNSSSQMITIRSNIAFGLPFCGSALKKCWNVVLSVQGQQKKKKNEIVLRLLIWQSPFHFTREASENLFDPFLFATKTFFFTFHYYKWFMANDCSTFRFWLCQIEFFKMRIILALIHFQCSP